MVGDALELESADEASAGAGLEPALDEPQEPCRVTDHVREQPIDRSECLRIEREGALAPHVHPGHGRDGGIERRLVDADHPRAQHREHPGPAPGAATEIETALATPRMLAEEGQGLPKLEISAARGC